jgi:hypothetical protein
VFVLVTTDEVVAAKVVAIVLVARDAIFKGLVMFGEMVLFVDTVPAAIPT